ncbi:MAG: hypothetical protein U9Q22_07295, partial [Candidatus Altiarchaeota archaeon]|nr:hypothetical protein [Candidatus Altiarchaeota archaeon]
MKLKALLISFFFILIFSGISYSVAIDIYYGYPDVKIEEIITQNEIEGVDLKVRTIIQLRIEKADDYRYKNITLLIEPEEGSNHSAPTNMV